MAQVIVCCAQKGGCAKTVTVHNLSTALSQMGKKILAVDFDAQASLTICFGIEPRTPSVNIAHLMDMQAQDLPTPTKEDFVLHCSGIDLIPSSSRLSAISEMLRHEIGCERFLSNILNTLRNDYDYIIVDTGPKLDNLSVNALIAADQLLIPVNPQFLSTAGLQPLLEMIHKVRLRFNPKIQISGILLTMCEQRTNLCKIISSQIRDAYSGTVPIFENSIPMNVKVGESVYYAQSVLDYAPTSKAACAYKRFAVELDQKLSLDQSTSAPASHSTQVRVFIAKKGDDSQ